MLEASHKDPQAVVCQDIRYPSKKSSLKPCHFATSTSAKVTPILLVTCIKKIRTGSKGYIYSVPPPCNNKQILAPDETVSDYTA